MWRTRSTHKRGETEFLDAAMDRIGRDASLRERAEKTLDGVLAKEPLFAEALRAPQSPPHHLEGPVLKDHLRIMLMVLYAIQAEQLHLIDVEEFRRLKGYEGELEELEELLKENAALFEVFVLCHDAAKWHTLSFTSLPGSEGEALGFVTTAAASWEDEGAVQRASQRERYLEQFAAFSKNHESLSPSERERTFFEAYGIQVHYPGHDRAVHSPVYRALLGRLCAERRLPDRDRELLEDLIARHLEPIADFKVPSPTKIGRYVKISEQRGWDADDFIDLLQGGLFLDGVCGSKRAAGTGQEGGEHEAGLFINFLRSEHDYAPWRRAEKEKHREELRKKEQQKVFRDVGLDGVALMDLLGMDPGPAFGSLLRRIHETIVGEGTMPALPPKSAEELRRRIDRYYAEVFPRDL